jgi:hypothetical protein
MHLLHQHNPVRQLLYYLATYLFLGPVNHYRILVIINS